FFDYTLQLADNSLIMGHRLSEWAGHGPMLEQDIALSNIALDMIGQSRNFYQYAAEIKNQFNTNGEQATEDTLAYLRDSAEFKNCVLAEIPNGDWGQTILKLYFFSTFQFLLYQELKNSTNTSLAAIAEKSLKETSYHLRWSAEWTVRLGDGTDESRQRMLNSLDTVNPYLNELFYTSSPEALCAENKIGVDPVTFKEAWLSKVQSVFEEATLPMDISFDSPIERVGKNGDHTSHLQHILDDMQMLQRSFPGCEW
ncbi:MAG: 1,2-phenylacetyl-CoA epoxidase subunit PaaC, partial [Ginsengibacter sp.]